MSDEGEKSWLLPLELIAYIADSPYPSQLTRLSLALCCKAVSRTAIRGLYRDIEPLSRRALLALEVVLTTNEQLASLVERLIFPLLVEVEVKGERTGLSTGVLDLLDCGMAGLYPTALSSGLPMSTTQYEELARSFFRSASVCGQLSALRMPNVDGREIWNSESLAQPFAPALKSLTIVFDCHIYFCTDIPLSLPALESLTILCAVGQDDQDLHSESLVNFHLPNLKTLKCYRTILGESLPPLLISCAPTLRTFVAGPSPQNLQPGLEYFRFPKMLCGGNYSNLTTLGVVYDVLSSRRKARKIGLQAFTSLRNLTVFVVSRRHEFLLRSNYEEMKIAREMPTVQRVTILDMNHIHKHEDVTRERLWKILINLMRYFQNLSHLSVFKRGIHPKIRLSNGEGRVAKFTAC